MDKVARLDARERNALFGETAGAMRTIPAIVEKDFWVVWVLDKLFSDAGLQRVLKFKGGTSLSKVFGLIGRFSEDIDLILDWREVMEGDPYLERSKSQQSQFNETTQAQAVKYIREVLLPDIAKLLAPVCECFIETDDPHSIHVRYPAAFKDAYLRPEILLEIGPLASWLPSAMFTIRSYASQHFPQVFERAECSVPTILAARTFWEKATILHQEAHRDKDRPMPLRYSRHYYDVALLAKSEVKKSALADLALLKEVVEFKQRFYPSAWAKYELAVPGSFRLVPYEARLTELEKDFQAMQSMIFDKHLSFEAMLDALSELEQEINALGSKA